MMRFLLIATALMIASAPAAAQYENDGSYYSFSSIREQEKEREKDRDRSDSYRYVSPFDKPQDRGPFYEEPTPREDRVRDIRTRRDTETFRPYKEPPRSIGSIITRQLEPR